VNSHAQIAKVYVGQRGCSLHIRYQEDKRNIQYNKEDSGCATHILNNYTNMKEWKTLWKNIFSKKRKIQGYKKKPVFLQSKQKNGTINAGTKIQSKTQLSL
jgi:hypothetical protein